jgi:hypothetical protein
VETSIGAIGFSGGYAPLNRSWVRAVLPRLTDLYNRSMMGAKESKQFFV